LTDKVSQPQRTRLRPVRDIARWAPWTEIVLGTGKGISSRDGKRVVDQAVNLKGLDMKASTVIKYLGLGVAVLVIPGGIPLAAAWLYLKHKEKIENERAKEQEVPPQTE